ncbi:GGDEF domain-containing protein [Amphritea pacifica]|uniref:GGDEF domain-containing protein n=1 Tax=Amphritea pacifica TaxID=2811233 RepID=UPI001964B066|nr:GGDEF domain-containing protein [Amphritea pacifica]MBN1007544.1 GGDEF domain-containing protein [Amphritea pacifica]
MKFADNPQQATEYLRRAIPLMVKSSIPPTPLNYALWYAYVSGAIPALNQQMDKMLEIYGTCPNRIGEQLFRDFLIKDEADNAATLQQALLSVMGDLESSASSTVQDTEAYNEVLQESLAALKDRSDDEGLETIIQNLTTNTETISESTRLFQQKIDEAQAEINKLKKELHESRQEATVDPLTGLYNRRVFDTEISQLAALPQPDVSLIMVDIDFFKKFNDTYGHQMGDKVLQYVARLIKEECSEPLLPVRFGGEEFSMLLPGIKVPDACELAEKVRKKVAAIRIKQKKSGEIISSVTASFGVARLAADESPENLIARADAALYRAKEAGRNNVQVAN